MLKKHKQFIRVFAIFLVLVIFANIVIPNISFASSYDDLKALVTETLTYCIEFDNIVLNLEITTIIKLIK